MLERCSLGVLDRGFSTGMLGGLRLQGSVSSAALEGVLGTGSPGMLVPDQRRMLDQLRHQEGMLAASLLKGYAEKSV